MGLGLGWRRIHVLKFSTVSSSNEAKLEEIESYRVSCTPFIAYIHRSSHKS
jgi:hypothetical protein